MDKWRGTAVPNTGLVEKVYLNINLNDEEITEICSKLTMKLEGWAEYILNTAESSDISLYIVDLETAYNQKGYAIINAITEEKYYVSTQNEISDEYPFVGWNPDFNGEIVVNKELTSEYNGVASGSQNELLFELFSSEPIIKLKLNLDEFLTDLADSIRYVKGTEDKINAQNFSSEIRGLGSGVDYLGLRLKQTDEYEYSNSEITTIPDYAFYGDNKITKASFQNLENIGSRAFGNNSNLKYIYIPSIKGIGDYSFTRCGELTDISLPNVTTINGYSFEYCTKLANINAPKATTIKNFAFRQCETILNAKFPLLTTIERDAFEYCYKLKSIYIPKTNNIGNLAFSACYSLLAVIITQTSKVATLGGNVFGNSYHILGTQNENYNPTGAKDGYIYVPDSLVDSYKAATNWSAYASQIKGISELPQEYKDLYGIA